MHTGDWQPSESDQPASAASRGDRQDFFTTTSSPTATTGLPAGTPAANLVFMTNDDTPHEGLTAAQRLALALGRPMPRRRTEEEIRAFAEAEARIDAEAERFYGSAPDCSAA
jgi:hypothetical protein